MTVIRDLLVSFGVAFDTSGIKKGESAIESLLGKLTGVGKALAGAFALDQVKDFALGVIQNADALGDQAARLNISVSALERWRYAAGFAEIQAESLDALFGRVARASVAAADGTSEQAKALDELGIKVKTANGDFKSTDVLFQEIGTSLAGLEDGTKRTALAMQFFGKADATKVLELFKGGDEQIAKLNAEFEELTGGGMADFVKASGEVDDELKRLNTAWEAGKVSIVGFFLPAIMAVVQACTRVAVWLRELNEHTSILKASMIALGVVGLSKLSMMLGPLGALARGFGLLALKVALPLLILEDFMTFLDGGDSMIGRVIDKFFGAGAQQKVRNFIQDVKKSLQDLWGGSFTNLLTNARNLALDFFAQLKKDTLAAGGPWADLNAAVLDVWSVTLDTLTGGLDNFLAKSSAIWDGIKLAFEIAWTEIKFFGLGIAAEMSDALDNLLNKFDQVLGIETDGKGGTAAADIESLHNQAKLRLAAEGDAIAKRLETSRVAVDAPIHQTINVPPGTPTGQAKALGKAAADGARKGTSEGINLGTSLPGTRPARAPNRAAAASFKRKGS
jgi:hypothetical protein